MPRRGGPGATQPATGIGRVNETGNGTSFQGVSGRYAFSLPEPRDRDGWFKAGPVDVTTTALVVGLGLVSMVLYAIDPAIVAEGMFASPLVRNGEIWRLATWPLINPPIQIWDLVGLAVFWFLGHFVEDQIGRVPFAGVLVAMTVPPALVVTLLGSANEVIGPWTAYSYGVSLLSLGLIVVLGVDRPDLRFFFGIPAWVIAAAYVLIEVLRDVGERAWAQLILVLLVCAAACFATRQRGMLDNVTWLPRLKAFGGGSPSPYGQPPSARRSKSGRKSGRGRGGPRGQVVEGPWSAPTAGLTPLEQAELDVLLDKVSAGGVASLSGTEQSRLQALSQRLRER